MKVTLDTPVERLHLVGPSKAQALERLGIYTIEDLLFHIPHRYNDYSLVTPIASCQPGETVTIKATLQSIGTFRTKSGKQMISATITDDSGKLTVIWFNQRYLLTLFKEGDIISFSGSITWFGSKLVLSNPQFEILSRQGDQETLHTGRLVAVYPETEGITSKWLRNRIHSVLEQQHDLLVDELPDAVVKKESLLPLSDAVMAIHFPKTLEQATHAKKRIAFDEVLFYQVRAKLRKKEWETTHTSQSIRINSQQKQKFFSQIPFDLTDDQQTVIQELSDDLLKHIPMNRLMVGDVGSGKTIVAAYAMYATYISGYSAVLMAPTQILAEQHHKTISQLLAPLGISVDLMTGTTKTIPTQNPHHQSLFDETKQKIVVGTHALLANQDSLGQVAFVVIDEQHRFGVKQRGVLTEPTTHGTMPHLLTMTATPIPRTIAKTLFGNLDISFLLTLPKGRQLIKTWLVPNDRREKGYAWIETQMKETGGQVFVICPLIESSETLTTVKAVTKEYESLKKNFPHRSIGLLHGRMKGTEKTAVLTDFTNKKHDILLATPVVEVGIDIPNATIILIEAAERFGLGQLHQLRGRVGRSEKQSYCLLYTESEEEGALTRLKAMESLHSGPQLAELDLHLRGAGDIFGTKQHGIPLLRVAQLTDAELLDHTSACADDLLKLDPELMNFPLLREKLKKVTIDEQIQD